ncbi:hypothetical protein D7Y21_19960 [Corallococcus sp. AB045]|uniref:hypothetical protein n=1 Tax=Corallococcus sp. AB045 TaxID=2316719 RepID=UPI000EC8E7AB|nr:hypothetical protein [Corallococcus sp. AB045]RKH86920.1 hypothetical protein D7Y21_19960 [Corallococcus sp. AB045]
MGTTFSSIAFTFRAKLGKHLPLGHAQQVLAAALGYKTYASFNASKEEAALDSVQHVVLDLALIDKRLGELGQLPPSAPYSFAQAIRAAIIEHLPTVRVHNDVDNLKDEIRSLVEREIEDSGAYTSEVAMTNAYGGDFDLESEETSSFEDHEPEWVLDVSGHVYLEQEPEQVYHGDTIDVSATAVLPKLGRCMLGELKVIDIGAVIQPEPYPD